MGKNQEALYIEPSYQNINSDENSEIICKKDTKKELKTEKAQTKRQPLMDVTNEEEKPVLKVKIREIKDLANIEITDIEAEEKNYYKRLKDEGWVNCDYIDKDDFTMVSEYAEDVFRYVRRLEKRYMPSDEYIGRLEGKRKEKRIETVNWLVDTHWSFRFRPETLFIAVNLFDRFLSVKDVPISRYMQLASTSLLIASKIEESSQVTIKAMVSAVPIKLRDTELASAETYMLRILNFSIWHPSPYIFLRRTSKAERYDPYTRTVAKYLLEISLYEATLLSILPSKMAAACILLARKMLSRNPHWNPTLVHYSGYEQCVLEPISDEICDSLSKSYIISGSICRKYSLGIFYRVSIFADKYIRNRKSKLSDNKISNNNQS